MKTERIFVSMPADGWQTDAERELKWKRIVELGCVTAVFTDPRGTDSLAASRSWSCVLTRDLELSVLDWATDFDPARHILQQIESAAERCGAGTFLFSADDLLAADTPKVRSVPRDNVVYEAGYFSAAKGEARTLIVLQDGARMTADLGGDIDAAPSGQRIDAIRLVLRKFAESL